MQNNMIGYTKHSLINRERAAMDSATNILPFQLAHPVIFERVLTYKEKEKYWSDKLKFLL